MQPASGAPAIVPSYFLEVKQSAQKELDALDDAVFSRIAPQILAPADNPRPAGMQEAQRLQRSLANSDRRLASNLHR
jgi:hypothetical protein